jgi:hypothetical protein
MPIALTTAAPTDVTLLDGRDRDTQRLHHHGVQHSPGGLVVSGQRQQAGRHTLGRGCDPMTAY